MGEESTPKPRGVVTCGMNGGIAPTMYYDVDKTLSRNKLFNFVVGPRGAGKTFGAKDRVMRNFLKRGEQFVYLRRYDTELPAAEMKNFFDDIAYKYPDHNWKCGRGLFTCDELTMGWYFPLSKAIMLKSIPFPNVSLIVFDEFIIDVGVYRYLQREVHTFLECYSTISRDRDVQALFLSNAITFTNPYFTYFNLRLEEGQKTKLIGDISLELVENPEYIAHAASTRFGKLISQTDYGSYAVANKFLRDNDTFVAKPQESTYYICTLLYQGNSFGLYRGRDTGYWYATPKVDPSCKDRIALDRDDHNDDTYFSRSGKTFLAAIISAYSAGAMRFYDIRTKNLLQEALRKVL